MRPLLALLCALPLSALAQEPAAPSAAAPAWSIGGGLLFQTYLLVGVRSASTGVLPSSPSAIGSLERRVGARTWLTLDVNGAVARGRADVPTGGYGYARNDSRQLNLAAGLRHALTGPAAPVEVSLLASASGGYFWGDSTYVSGASSTAESAEGWLAGASLGLAVDRELTAGLSVRVATSLASLGWVSGRTRTGAESGHASQLTLGVALAPRLELRLAF